VHTNAGSILHLEEAAQDSISLQHAVTAFLDQHVMLHEKNSTDDVIAVVRKSDNKTTLFFFALIGLYLFSAIRLWFPKYVLNLFSFFTSFNTSKRQMKEQLEIDSRASIWFFLLYIITLGYLFFSLGVSSISWIKNAKMPIAIFSCIVLMAIVYLVKIGLVNIVAWVFNKTDLAKKYIFDSLIINEFLGILLLPLCILLLLTSATFHTLILNISLFIILCFFTFKYVRMLPKVINLLRMDFLHFLLYLCAFELMPVFILAKISLKGI